MVCLALCLLTPGIAVGAFVIVFAAYMLVDGARRHLPFGVPRCAELTVSKSGDRGGWGKHLRTNWTIDALGLSRTISGDFRRSHLSGLARNLVGPPIRRSAMIRPPMPCRNLMGFTSLFSRAAGDYT
jgi:hypothetical protein